MKTMPLRTFILLCFLVASLSSWSLAAAPAPASFSPGGVPLGGNDTTPPVTTCTIHGIMQGQIYISNVTVILNATDDLSGVNATYYQVDSENLSVYTEPLIVTDDGQHTVMYYSVDNVGNVEAQKNASFTIILASPVSIAIGGGVGPMAWITNIGTEDLVDTPFSISLDNGFYLMGQYRNGTVSIRAGQSVILRSFVVGIGEPTIRVRVGRTEASIDAFVLGVFVIRI